MSPRPNLSLSNAWTTFFFSSFTSLASVDFVDEYSNIADTNSVGYIVPDSAFDNLVVATTPLPTALPLFATGVGLVVLLGRRKAKKVAATATV